MLAVVIPLVTHRESFPSEKPADQQAALHIISTYHVTTPRRSSLERTVRIFSIFSRALSIASWCPLTYMHSNLTGKIDCDGILLDRGFRC